MPVGASAGLHRVLGRWFPMAVAVGTMIGLGIFRTPGEVAAAIPDPVAYLTFWVCGCLFVILSTSVVGEVMSLTDRSGGNYALVRRGLGPFPAFFLGWVDWLAYGATIALKSVVFAEFLVLLVPELEAWQVVIALGVNVLFAALQLVGIEAGGRIQIGAAIGLVAITVLSTLAVFVGGTVASAADSIPPMPNPGLTAYGLAAASIVFTLDGWLAGSYFGGEVEGGGASVARSSLRAVCIVSLLYLLLNAALVFALGTEQMAGDDLPVKTALDALWGSWGGQAVVIALLLILLAGLNIHYLAGPRVIYALSVDGLGVDSAASVSEGGNPLIAVFLTAALSVAMIALGGFNELLNLSVLLFVLLYMAVMLSVLALRIREPDTPRPFRAWMYPYSLVVALLGWLAISVFMAVAAPETAWSAAAMAVVSVPMYAAVKWLHRRSSITTTG